MDNDLPSQIGSWVCRLLDVIGLVPNACYNAPEHGMIGQITGALLFAILIVIGWCRWL